jgi:CRISPR-associated endonuclease/helicase Cas3
VAVLLSGDGIPSVDPRMLGFLVPVHDIGKFSHPFQAKAPAYWPVGVLGPYPAQHLAGPAHDTVGASILTHALADRFTELLPGSAGRQADWKPANRMHLWRALSGHHGRPPRMKSSAPSAV